jgi:hypothetical protein
MKKQDYFDWVLENYFRMVYTKRYASKQDGSGGYSSKELRQLYKTRHSRAEVETKKVGTFFEFWSSDTTDRTFDQLAKIYSKLK